MITTEQARTLQQASAASYDQNPSLTGYSVVTDLPLTDPKTGFNAVIFKKDGTNEYIIAFTGTEPRTSQDPLADLTLGISQWRKVEANVLAALNSLEGATKISFTGHSLGGAHAQYGAYRYLAQGGSVAVKGVRNAYGSLIGDANNNVLVGGPRSDSRLRFKAFYPSLLSSRRLQHERI